MLQALAVDGVLPRRTIFPLTGFSKPTISRIKVVLPAPLDPNSPKLMFRGISSDISLITLRCPYLKVRFLILIE
jgi:hypothetical protein